MKKLSFLYKSLIVVVIISMVPPILNIVRYGVFGIVEPGVENGPDQLLLGVIYSLVTTTTLFFGSAAIIHFLNSKFSWKSRPVKRIIAEAILIFGFATGAQIIIIYGFTFTPICLPEELTPALYFENILFGNTLTLIVVAIIEGNYFLVQWKSSLVLAEKAKQESIKSQYNSLKSQLDPHFLFNSLNVLSTLIRKDAEKAEWFIDDFAKVYRYVLEVNNEMVVSLNSELDFIKSYINLQQIRFTAALELQINISSEQLENFIPPLSLQELVNNAIKHNEVSLERPLKIEVYTEGSFLMVKNNLQARRETVISTGLGLENLKKRYQLLNDQEPTFLLEGEMFIAKIPLLQVE